VRNDGGLNPFDSARPLACAFGSEPVFNTFGKHQLHADANAQEGDAMTAYPLLQRIDHAGQGIEATPTGGEGALARQDDAVGKVAGAGGTVMQSDITVLEAGRMAIVADPAGAVICLWEAKDHIGCEVVNEHGALTWNELMTPDPAAVAPFYGEVFGWTSQAMPMPSGEYTVFFVEGGSENGIAGAMQPPMEGMPSFWGVYFHVDDAAATVETAKGLGAQVLMEATPMDGVGTLASMVRTTPSPPAIGSAFTSRIRSPELSRT